MAVKRIICPERLRRVPRQFSWVDHRLIRDGHISRYSHEALALYLFLVTVSDAAGLSYYSDEAVCRLLNMDDSVLRRVRHELRDGGLIAYRRPLYQVLSLDNPAAGLSVLSCPAPRRSSGEAVSIGDVLRQAAGAAS
jgi:hypothetical protein